MAARRIDALVPLDDPRLVLAMVKWLVEMPFRTVPTCQRFWSKVFHHLSTHGPADLDRERLARKVRSMGTNFAMRHANQIEKLNLPAARRALTETEHQALLEGGFVTVEPPVQDLSRLRQAVVDDLDDLGARAVLADALQMVDDPLGEFIALQIDNGTDVESVQRFGSSIPAYRDAGSLGTRESELLREHANAWLGPWVAAICRVSWHHGFPMKLLFDRKHNKIGRLAAEPALQTVRAVELSPHRYDPKRGPLRKTLNSRYFVNLVALEWLYVSDLEPVRASLAGKIRRLGVRVDSDATLATLAAELEHWTALDHLDLFIERGSMFAVDPDPEALALLGRFEVRTLQVRGMNGMRETGQPTDIGRLVANVAPVVKEIGLSPFPRAWVRAVRDNETFRQITYEAVEDQFGATPAIDLDAWGRARQVGSVTVVGMDRVWSRASQLEALADLHTQDVPIDELRILPDVGPPAEWEPPPLRVLVLDLRDDCVPWVAFLDAHPQVQSVDLRNGPFLTRNSEGRLNVARLDWYQWHTKWEARLHELAPLLERVSWSKGSEPDAFRAFKKEHGLA